MRLLMFLLLAFISSSLFSQHTIRVTSEELGREIAVVIYPSDQHTHEIVYFTEGQKCLDNGFVATIDSLNKAGAIPAAHYVFVSTIDQAGIDRRQEYFFSEPAYLRFFENELLPTVEEKLEHGGFDPSSRSIVGISFGGLNACYFASQNGPFENYGLLSPITYPDSKLSQKITFGPRKGQRFFISSGTHDAENYVRELRNLYSSQEHEIKYLQTKGGHDFTNWRGQLNELLKFLLNPMTMYIDQISPTEYNSGIYYYASKAAGGSSLSSVLENSKREMIAFINGISEDAIDYRYGPEKWTVGEVLHRVINYEEIMLERARVIAGVAPSPLRWTRYNQSTTVVGARGMSKSDLLEKFVKVREQSIRALLALSSEQLKRMGTMDGNRTSVRALALCLAGHQEHHFDVLRNRYLSGR